MNKRIFAALAACALLGSVLTGCGNAATGSTSSAAQAAESTVLSTADTGAEKNQSAAPKYVFLFIGDGMSYPQLQAAADYKNVLANDPKAEILKGDKKLGFMEFPVAGSATTYDSSSFCPDSASTATSISTGNKTYSGVINMSEDMSTSYETIAEKVKEQLGYKVGIVSTVNLNHATPAAFYAHQETRNNYYEIGVEMVESGFDYFGGGALKDPTGTDKDKEDVYALAQKAGYTVAKTQKEAEAITDGKAVIIGETLADSDSLSYDNDRKDSEWALKDYVKKGIDLLKNDKGFFMMVEGGKIDWACHANDAGSTIADTLALDEAVDTALEFYQQYPEDTLILVTGDHETGGLSVGFAGTDYDTYLNNITNQKLSYAKFDSDFVAGYKEKKTDFETVLKDVEENFGLAKSGDSGLVLTEYELGLLKAAYDKTMSGSEEELTQEEYIMYGTYEPLTVTITHLLNNKSGLSFTSYAHTGLPVAVFAQGAGQDSYQGFYDNTDIYNKTAELLMLK